MVAALNDPGSVTGLERVGYTSAARRRSPAACTLQGIRKRSRLSGPRHGGRAWKGSQAAGFVRRRRLGRGRVRHRFVQPPHPAAGAGGEAGRGEKHCTRHTGHCHPHEGSSVPLLFASPHPGQTVSTVPITDQFNLTVSPRWTTAIREALPLHSLPLPHPLSPFLSLPPPPPSARCRPFIPSRSPSMHGSSIHLRVG